MSQSRRQQHVNMVRRVQIGLDISVQPPSVGDQYKHALKTWKVVDVEPMEYDTVFVGTVITLERSGISGTEDEP